MSRIPLASLASGTLYNTVPFVSSENPTGAAMLTPAAGVGVYLRVHGTSTPISVWSAETGGTVSAQPIQTTSTGEVPGWVETTDLPGDLVVGSAVYYVGFSGDVAGAAAAEATRAEAAEAADVTRAEAAEALLVPLTQKGAASGVASLDSSSKLLVGQLPVPVTSTTPDVIAPVASGNATTDTTNLQAALNAAAGGFLFIPNASKGGQTKYMVNAPLVVPQNIRIEGQSLVELWVSDGQGNTGTNGPGPSNSFVRSTAFAGVVIEQQTAATDVFQFPHGATTAHLRNIAAGYSDTLADTNTGTPFNVSPTDQASGHSMGPLPDDGLFGSTWENVVAYAHDGNHYGFIFLNFILCTMRHLRSYGGGGYLFQSSTAISSYGNTTVDHAYAWVYNPGTAHGYGWDAQGVTFPGALGLTTLIRPQAIASNAVLSAATQGAWNDNAGGTGFDPLGVTAIAPDLENFAANSKHYVSPNTTFIGNGLISISYGRDSYYLHNVWHGYQALGKLTTGDQNVAVGYQASASLGNNHNNTAVGYQALNANLGANGVAVGSGALASTASGATSTAVGYHALNAMTTGGTNTAVGTLALATLVTGTNNTAVGYAALTAATSTHNVAVGDNALLVATTATGNVAIGSGAGEAATSIQASIYIGQNAGYKPGGNVANATVAANKNTFVGHQTGVNSTGDFANATALGYQAMVNGHFATALGYQALAGALGAVAIGTDSAGTGASTTTSNVIALGTALHQVQVKNNTTGAGSAALGANCPAVTATAPYTWMKMMSSDGSTVYVPAWK